MLVSFIALIYHISISVSLLVNLKIRHLQAVSAAHNSIFLIIHNPYIFFSLKTSATIFLIPYLLIKIIFIAVSGLSRLSKWLHQCSS